MKEIYNNQSYYSDHGFINERDDLKNYLKNNPNSHINDLPELKNMPNTNQLDGLGLITLILQKSISFYKAKADEIALETQKKSHAITEINRLWGKIMANRVKDVDPTKIDKKTVINRLSDASKIDDIIKNELGISSGANEISEYIMNGVPINYDQLQAVNANVTSFTNKIQVDIDAKNQDFKNIMTQLTSAQDELTNLSKIIVDFARR